MLAERDSKIAEFDVHLRKKDERFAIMENELRQRVQGEQLNSFFHSTVYAASSENKNNKNFLIYSSDDDAYSFLK